MTTTIDPSAVATMQGRELDAAIGSLLFELPRVEHHPIGWLYNDGRPDSFVAGCWHQVPNYSTNPAAFFAMVERVREAGWHFIASDGGVDVLKSPQSEEFTVDLYRPDPEAFDGERSVQGHADTLPLAFARAALLTTITNGGAS